MSVLNSLMIKWDDINPYTKTCKILLMTPSPVWQQKLEKELETAAVARSRGNEGMARVCARRAAGIAVGEYLTRLGYEVHTPSVIARLRFLLSLPNIPSGIHEVAEHFLLHIDEQHKLPIEADLVAEARWLVTALLGNLN